MKKCKKNIIFSIICILFVISLVLLLIKFITKPNTSDIVLGNYYGISNDQAWETSFKVFKNEKYNNDIMIDGYVVCLDSQLMNKYSEDDIDKCNITGLQTNKKGSFNGNFIYHDNKFRLITFVIDDYMPFEKMIISIGGDTIELKISKTTN